MVSVKVVFGLHRDHPQAWELTKYDIKNIWENSRVNPGSFHVTFWELISRVAETEGTFPDSLVSENDQCVGWFPLLATHAQNHNPQPTFWTKIFWNKNLFTFS